MIPHLSPAEIAVLRAQVATRSAELVRELPWLDAVDERSAAAGERPQALKIVVFNVERGTRFAGIVALVRDHPELRGADVMLLNEVDWGMARSGTRHVARDLADALGLGYAFGTEFLELTKGEAAELDAPGANTWSLHGNAILSRWPLLDARVLRLPTRCGWAEGSQARIGGRMALLAEVEMADGAVTLACTHLENRTTPDGRRDQLRALLEVIPADRAIIGGDLNTSTLDAGQNDQIFSVPTYLAEDPERLRRPEQYEPLFAEAESRGFEVAPFNPCGVPTNVPLGIMDPTYWLKLDWIFARGLQLADAAPPRVVPAAVAGQRVSDHDALVATLSVRP